MSSALINLQNQADAERIVAHLPSPVMLTLLIWYMVVV